MWVEPVEFIAHEFECFVELRRKILCFLTIDLNRHGANNGQLMYFTRGIDLRLY